MSSEPPSDTSQELDDGLDPESLGPDSGRGHSADREKRLWLPVATIAGVLAVAGGIAAFLFFTSSSDSADDQSSPRQGLACPYLRQAAAAYEEGDSALFDRTIAQAAKVAEGTLQKSGQAFGEPERIALELDLAPDQSSARIERLLRLALRDCPALESA